MIPPTPTWLARPFRQLASTAFAGMMLADMAHAAEKPNIVFFLADDWGRNAGCYRDPARPSVNDVIKTPNIDRVASEGVRFNNAFYDCPQCNPSRSAIVTGSYFWRAGSNAFLSGTEFKAKTDPFDALPRFPHLLAENGYETAKAVKTLEFNPTMQVKVGGYKRYGLYLSEGKTATDREQRRQEVIDQTRDTIKQVLAGCPKGKPFFFVFGPLNAHRPYAPGSGQALWGINPDLLKGKLPSYLPDVPEVRTDYADYLGEVQALDLMVGIFQEELEKARQLENTILVLTGDNGLPGFPRGKTQLYDLGMHAPLIIRWPGHVVPRRTVDDFVTLKDLAPTFLAAAGVPPPAMMDGHSLLPLLLAKSSGLITATNDAAIFGRERHIPNAREGNLPYPARAIRTQDFLYVLNFKPDRYPFGDPRIVNIKNSAAVKISPNSFLDMDSSLTKTWLLDHWQDPAGKDFYELAFGRRPAEELYDLRKDPQQTNNLAGAPEYQATQTQLAARLLKVLQDTHDPRLEDAFDRAPYIEHDTLLKPSPETSVE